MSLFTKLRYVPKQYGVVAAFLTAALVPAALMAWGPDRATFTVANPAPYVTFNSITDNPNVGDERNFVVVKEASDTNGAWKDAVNVEAGKEYLVRMYVHNNANANLNLKAINTRVTAAVPTTTGKNVPVSGFVTADNAQPQKVWDDVNFTSDKNFNLAYVAGSARIYNNGYAAGGNGQALSDSIVDAGGAQIGYNAPNGEVPGCFQYANYVYFKVKPQFEVAPNFEVAKTVSKHDAFAWTENVSAKPGDKVDFRIKYKNIGEVAQNDVVVKDQLPADLSYVNGTTKLYNALFPNGKVLTDGVIGGGVNIGHYAPGASGFVVFTAQVAANDKLDVCGPNVIKNVATVETDNGAKSDDASVSVTKECQTTEKSSFVCTGLEKISKSKTEYSFKATADTKGNVTIKEVKYDFGDNNSKLANYGEFVSHEYKVAGTYTIKAHITYVIDGKTVTDNNVKCTTSVTIPATPETPTTPETPETPAALPSTGPEALVGGLFGSSALGLGIHSWLSSRRALRDATRR